MPPFVTLIGRVGLGSDRRQRPAVAGAVRCSAMRSRPAGAAAVLGRPTTPGTIGLQRLAAPLTGPWLGGARSSLRTLAGGPEQLLRRAADRPAGADHPAGQLRTRDEQIGRRNGWDSLGQ